MYKLFIDDHRHPMDCITYMQYRIGARNSIYLEYWTIVRNYHQFVEQIKNNGLPEVVSFDHDLADEHYFRDYIIWEEYHRWDGREMTGYDCAKWLIEYCQDNKLKLPECFVHSMNIAGKENIENLLKNYRKHQINE